MECPTNYTISVELAFYGRKIPIVCDYADNVDNCEASDTLSVVRGLCNGKQICEVMANDTLFSDVCSKPGVYLEIKYTCLTGRWNMSFFPFQIVSNLTHST